MLGLILVTSDLEITVDCIVWISQSIPPQRIFAHFERLSPCAKTRSVALADFFVAQTVIIGGQKISPKSYIFLNNFTDSYYSRPNSFRLHRPGSGSSISSKYVGITRSLATRKKLGIPKVLKWINKAQPEPEPFQKNTAQEPEPCLRKQRAPETEPEPIQFYNSSAALVHTSPIATGGFWGHSPPKKSSEPHKLKHETL